MSPDPTELTFVFTQLKILGSCRTPFAVKGGGHSTNPGFSSTPGVQIALSRLNSTTVNVKDGTVEIGPGLTWDQVYEALGSTGVNVVGGRVTGVGVAGLTLGGGIVAAPMTGWLIISDCRIFVQVESIRTRY